MIGEMYGTNEPAQFIEGLTKLCLKQNDKVSVGLELPKKELIGFSQNQNDSSTLRNSKF